MTRLHHIAITADDLASSAAFFNTILPILGYEAGHVSDELCTWHSHSGTAPEILLYAAEGLDRSPHSHGRPGWQHAAFEVDDRSVVDELHLVAKGGNGSVLYEPQEYPDYAQNCSASGYYAVFLVDPSGVRIEVAHIPRSSATS